MGVPVPVAVAHRLPLPPIWLVLDPPCARHRLTLPVAFFIPLRPCTAWSYLMNDLHNLLADPALSWLLHHQSPASSVRLFTLLYDGEAEGARACQHFALRWNTRTHAHQGSVMLWVWSRDCDSVASARTIQLPAQPALIARSAWSRCTRTPRVRSAGAGYPRPNGHKPRKPPGIPGATLTPKWPVIKRHPGVMPRAGPP